MLEALRKDKKSMPRGFLVLIAVVVWEALVIGGSQLRGPQSEFEAASVAPENAIVEDSPRKRRLAHRTDNSTDDKSNTLSKNFSFVTFVIPSSLQRETLIETIQSLQNQTDPDWKAVVGVDIRSAMPPNNPDTRAWTKDQIQDRIQLFSSRIENEPRIQFVPIHTASNDRGKKHNGAGAVRNQIIKRHVQSEWVSFVDDDDTLAPKYVEHLRGAVNITGGKEEDINILVFRMVARRRIIPRPRQNRIQKNDVGISYAVRRSLFLSNEKNMIPLAFQADPAEDFLFLRTARDAGYTTHMSSCLGYFVGGQSIVPLPAIQKPFDGDCTVIEASVEDQVYQPNIVTMEYSSTSSTSSKRFISTTVIIPRR